jgi:hypothetical protein
MATDTKKRPPSPTALERAFAHQPTAVGANASTSGPVQKGSPAWMKERDPVKALHHVVAHIAQAAQQAPLTEKVKFDLGSALKPLLAPYEGQINAANAFNAATAGPGASAQMQQASMAAPDLSQYLGQIQQGLAANPGLGVSDASLAGALTSGLANIGRTNQGYAPAIAAQGSQAGQAGLLADLLNAAKYQAIYKQTDFGSPPTNAQDPALAQLYASVVAGGNQLTNTLPTSITSPTKTSTTPAINQPFSGV